MGSLLQPPSDYSKVISCTKHGGLGPVWKALSCMPRQEIAYLASLSIASLSCIIDCCCRGFCRMKRHTGFFNVGFWHTASGDLIVWYYAIIFTKSENWPLDLVVNTLQDSCILVFWIDVQFSFLCIIKKWKQDSTSFWPWLYHLTDFLFAFF